MRDASYERHHDDDADDRLWTSEDVMRYLHVKPSKFFYLRAKGEMVPPVTRIGNSLRFDPAEVRAWALSGGPHVTEWEASKRRNKKLFGREKL